MKYTMTANEAAQFLDVDYRSFLTLIRTGQIDVPHKKIGSHYKFSEIALRQWLGEQIEMEMKEDGKLVVV